MDQREEVPTVTLPAGTICHYGGMPFRLLADVTVEMRRENYELAAQFSGKARIEPVSTTLVEPSVP